MINLLPQQQKEEILQEEHLKLVLILGIVFISFLLSLSLIFFSIKIYILKDWGVQKMSLEGKEKEFSLNQELEEEIKNSNLILSKLDSFYQNQLNLTQILEKISRTLPQGTYLTSFNFSPPQKKGKGTGQVSLSGFCPTREILLEFKENLGREEEFEEVFLPPENWINPDNINFSVTFKLK